MGRTAARLALGAILLSLLLACSRTDPTLRPQTVALSPTAEEISAPTAAPTATATPAPTSTIPPTGRLPAVLARLSISLPEGDAYSPQAAAIDEKGQAVVLCRYHGQPGAPTSALIVVDPEQGTRGPALALPDQALGVLAVASGRAYVGYQDAQYRQHLAAVDLESGRVLVEAPVDGLFAGDALAADTAGHLYALLSEALEVRDPTTLQVMRSLPLEGEQGQRALAYDPAHSCLYLAIGERLRAYRTPDLTLLWEANMAGSEIRALLLDCPNERVYVRCERYEEGNPIARLQALEAGTGHSLGEVPAPEGLDWRLVAADGLAGYLLFAKGEQANTRLWQTALDGSAAGVQATVSGYAQLLADGAGHLLALVADRHLVHIYDAASLQPLSCVATGIEIQNLVTNPLRERAYLNDSAGRVHVLDSRTNTLQGTLQAGSGALTLDAANRLLFVGREPWGHEIAVIDTAALTVTAEITGGYKVAVDSVGRRAFVGWAGTGVSSDGVPGEVQIWDTNTFQRIGAITHRGEPTYNPLRDEIYLRDYSAYVVDGQSLTVTGELTPDVSDTPIRWCNGCPMVQSITVDVERELIVVGMTTLSAGKGPGTMPKPRLLSARTGQPVTHTATVLTSLWGDVGPFVIPPDDGWVYDAERYARYVTYNAALAYEAGAEEPADYREGLSIDLYLPGRSVALSMRAPYILAYDPRNWLPLGWIPYQPIQEVDLTTRRLYAWERSLLTVLSFDGGDPLAPEPSTPWPDGKRFNAIEAIHFSPGFAEDNTLFVVGAGQILRSSDAGQSWTLLSGLPPAPSWGMPSYCLALSPTYTEDSTLFVGGQVGESVGLGVWRSTDGGETWTPGWRGLTHLRVSDLAVSPDYAEDRTLLAYSSYELFWKGDSGMSLFRSTDGGASWALEATHSNIGTNPPLPAPEEALPYPKQSVQFRVAGFADELQLSTDGGLTWRPVLRPEQPGLKTVVRSPGFDEDGQAYILTPYTLYRTTDGGNTWEAADDPRVSRPGGSPDLTALDVALDGEGQPIIALGDRDGVLTLLDPDELTWVRQPVLRPTPTPIPTPTPCSPAVAHLGDWQQEQIGCPSAEPEELAMAAQAFEHGRMFWLSGRQEIYLLYSDGEANHWLRYPDTWEEGQPDHDPALQPPEGLEQPVRGFGRVWREELGGPESAVGWATAAEEGYEGQVQAYSGGLVFSAPEGRLFALLEDGTWVTDR